MLTLDMLKRNVSVYVIWSRRSLSLVKIREENNERRWDGLHLDILLNDHLLAYVGGPRFVNLILCSLANDALSVCMGVAIM